MSDCHQNGIIRVLLVSEKMHFDGTTCPIVGGVKGFFSVIKAIPMSNKGFGNMWIAGQYIYSLFKIMVFVVMAIEHGRDNGDFLQHQGV